MPALARRTQGSPQVRQALGNVTSVVNVGAGTGSYEPKDCEVLAIEPSATMIAQRPSGSAKVIQAEAEGLPLADKSFAAAMAVNTVHHWNDLNAGLREPRRVARERLVIFLRNPECGTRFWLTDDYFPSLDGARKMSAIVGAMVRELPLLRVVPVRLPADCVDGVFTSYWARPELYLDAEIRRNISNFALAPAGELALGLTALRADLDSGAWDRKYGDLRSHR